MGKTYGKTRQTCRCNEDRMVIFDGIFDGMLVGHPLVSSNMPIFTFFWRFDGKIIEPNGRLSTSKKLSTGRYPIRFDRTC